MARTVFLLPHPDDEFAVSVLLRDAVRAGDDVHVVYLTDGGFGGQGVERREQESRRVLARLGVPGANVQFLGREQGLPDGELFRHLARARQLLSRFDGDSSLRMFVPAWEGGHQDHDATHLLGLSFVGAVNDVRQFPLYHGAGLPGPFFRVMAPLPQNGPSRRRRTGARDRLGQLRICLSYPSQWKTWVGLTPLVALHLLCDGGFHTQPVDPERTSLPPHAGRPLYERRGFLAWREFHDGTADFRRTLPARPR